MSITAKKVEFIDQSATQESNTKMISDNYLGLIGSVEVECLVRLGSMTMTIAELRKLKQGQQLTLSQKTHEPIDMVLNNTVIARGELMTVDDCFAIQITEVTGE